MIIIKNIIKFIYILNRKIDANFLKELYNKIELKSEISIILYYKGDTMHEVDALIKLAQHKTTIDTKRGDPKYFDYDWMIESIIGEAYEVKEEIKEKNSVHLEDELGDILWTLHIICAKLENDKLITSTENIYKRALQKYNERILPLQGDLDDSSIWQKVKAQQKQQLKKENQKRHS